ncbi:MAG: hypothetical protein HY713_01775 [candidate division NC10 bacterium]|nr:hypothetical protein [candidate division NC10 bacterium]
MGLEYTVRFPGGKLLELARVMTLLAERGFPVQLRMVDGELTLPTEGPPERWTDVRLGTPAGMVTLARRGQELAVVTWGNADEAMQRAWNAVTWAVAKAGAGEIVRPEGPQSPDEFCTAVGLLDLLKG